MYRQIISILIGLLWTSSMLGQVEDDVRKVLATKDFVLFSNFTDSLTNREKGIGVHWESYRDLTTDFQEAVLFIEKSVIYKENPTTYTVYTYRVTLITNLTTIIFYEFSEKKNKKKGDYWEPYYVPIEVYKSDQDFESLKSSFKSIYQADLNEDELFITDFVYGSLCNYAGEKPEGRKQIDIWVKSNNKTELLKWLRSTNTEKQVYAIDGLSQLKESKYKLTEEEKKIVDFIKNKNGSMYVCNGCIHSHQLISYVTQNFNF